MRIIMGIIWFFVIQFSLGLVGGCTTTYIQRSMGVSRGNTGIPPKYLPIILIASLGLTIWGTISGKLPGTKKK